MPTFINPKFDLERALELAKACELSIESGRKIVDELRNRRGYSTASFFDSGCGPEVYVAANDAQVLVVFRGSDRPKSGTDDTNLSRVIQDWHKNVDYRPANGPFGGYVHGGLFEVLIDADSSYSQFWSDVRLMILENLTYQNKALWLTGNSQGAVMATLSASLLVTEGVPVSGLYLFGSPRPGDERFCRGLESHVSNIFRIVNHNDPLPTLPPEFMEFGPEQVKYRHVGTPKYITEDCGIVDEVLRKERTAERLSKIKTGFESLFRGRDTGGAVAEIKAAITDGVTDHYIENYVANLTRALESRKS